MTQIAPYCKAYPAKRFQEFAGWTAREETPSTPEPSDRESDDAELDDYWFIQDTYVVTRGILPDEDIVFDQVSPEWIEFCRTTLEFAVPDDLIDESSPVPAADSPVRDAEA